LISRPRGTEDVLPEEVGKWYFIEEKARLLSWQYGYREIRTPIFEHTELFDRGVGDTTDIVEKEMYTFKDRSGRSLTLRPEGTAPVARAFLEHHLEAKGLPVKLFYLGPMFRYGRPQAGRLRQFHQFGVEAFGSPDPSLDAEVIDLAVAFLEAVGLKRFRLLLNSVGCPLCRGEHRERLLSYLIPLRERLCPTCRARLERNPLRIFDCKEESCQQVVASAPTITSSLCPECREHFHQVQGYLGLLGIDFVLEPRLVRGLDYYTRTAFELVVEEIGAQSAIGGGGRYDGLVELLGGKPIPGIGFALGLERVLLALEAQGGVPSRDLVLDVLVVQTSSLLKDKAVTLLKRLRAAGLKADRDYLDRSLKAQMKYANRYPARKVVILGEEEMSQGMAVVRDLASGVQETIPYDRIEEHILKAEEGDN